jgi:peroxiredoxin
MSDLGPLLPRQPVPPLSVPLAGGGTWTLAERQPRNFTLVVFYRGLHCPICRAYLAELQARLDDFAARGGR